ncbi:MAG: hypothetical protein AAGA56_06860 [Myxococcota bacterium]
MADCRVILHHAPSVVASSGPEAVRNAASTLLDAFAPDGLSWLIGPGDRVLLGCSEPTTLHPSVAATVHERALEAAGSKGRVIVADPCSVLPDGEQATEVGADLERRVTVDLDDASLFAARDAPPIDRHHPLQRWSEHRGGTHRYQLPRLFFEVDVVINLSGFRLDPFFGCAGAVTSLAALTNATLPDQVLLSLDWEWERDDLLWRHTGDLIRAAFSGVMQGGRVSVGTAPRRRYLGLVDALEVIEGDGDGDRVESSILVGATHPFAADRILCEALGLRPSRIPLLEKSRARATPGWPDQPTTTEWIGPRGRELETAETVEPPEQTPEPVQG